MGNNKKETNKFADKSWLLSDSFIKRAFAVWGHCVTATLIFYAVFFVIGLFIGLLFM